VRDIAEIVAAGLRPGPEPHPSAAGVAGHEVPAAR
jgi:hypothetical protein